MSRVETRGHRLATNVDQPALQNKIRELKKSKNAVLLAHYYQVPEIQDLADYVGDSLGLSQQAAGTSADIIVFAGVLFMAETAKILNPEKKVIVPTLEAGCSLADSAPPVGFKKFISENPGHLVVTYINCSAEIKAMSDLVCTSSNAERIIDSIPEWQPIIFAPDKNLGRYLIEKTGRTMKLWHGSCIVHESFAIDKLLNLYQQHPDAKIIAHPEAEGHILKVANFIGSTAALIDYARNDEAQKYIVATEAGILHKMKEAAPHKELLAAPSNENNTCACSECGFMKMNTLENLYHCLVEERHEIHIPDTIRHKAILPIQRMLELSKPEMENR
ncbi:MAG: quinolinate synthase NadA [Bacteroidetes bacterium]|nr:quinolinate synthase NadA [Bacteroidota bacterium]